MTFAKARPGNPYPVEIRLNFRNLIFDAGIELWEGMADDELRSVIPEALALMVSKVFAQREVEWAVTRDRCLIPPGFRIDHGATLPAPGILPDDVVQAFLRGLIHLPGLRGNAERTYNKTAFAEDFPGLFQDYFAMAIFVWQSQESPKLAELAKALQHLGLTWKVQAKQLSEAQLELRVGRLPKAKRGGAHDLVNIADVGVGVSQVLPVVVALLVAEKGQAVYIEQPEIHLHPQAQLDLAQLFADAANRGVRVIVETHSDSFLLGVQTLVAEGKLKADNVMLHWFTRDDEGMTDMRSSGVDKKGTFGEWPVDFWDVQMAAQDRYLKAPW